MTTSPAQTAVAGGGPVPAGGVFNSAMYQLIATKLGEDPALFIKTRRDQTPSVSYARIADEIRNRTEVYITHEIPRRWHRAYLAAQGQPVTEADATE